MMVARSPRIENVSQLLDQTTQKLTNMSRRQQEESKQDLADLQHELSTLIENLHGFNDTFDPKFWDDKKLTPEQIKDKMEKVLTAMKLFQQAAQKTVEQAIVALFATLTKEINHFDANIKNLKDYKIGNKVEKTHQSKEF